MTTWIDEDFTTDDLGLQLKYLLTYKCIAELAIKTVPQNYLMQ